MENLRRISKLLGEAMVYLSESFKSSILQSLSKYANAGDILKIIHQSGGEIRLSEVPDASIVTVPSVSASKKYRQNFVVLYVNNNEKTIYGVAINGEMQQNKTFGSVEKLPITKIYAIKMDLSKEEGGGKLELKKARADISASLIYLKKMNNPSSRWVRDDNLLAYKKSKSIILFKKFRQAAQEIYDDYIEIMDKIAAMSVEEYNDLIRLGASNGGLNGMTFANILRDLGYAYEYYEAATKIIQTFKGDDARTIEYLDNIRNYSAADEAGKYLRSCQRQIFTIKKVFKMT